MTLGAKDLVIALVVGLVWASLVPLASAGDALRPALFPPGNYRGWGQNEQDFRGSGEGRRQREASRGAYKAKSADEAQAVARDKFAARVARPAWRGLEVGPGAHIERYLDDSHALVSRSGETRKGVVEGNVPLLGRTPDGTKAPVDLRLTDSGDHWAPVSSGGRVEIPRHADSALTLTDLGIGLRMEGAPSTPGQLTSDKAFFANVATDTDLLLNPTPTGGELSWQLRSPDSPRDLTLHVDLRPGDSLRQIGDSTELGGVPGTVEVMRDGKAVAVIQPASARDAQGQAIKVSYEVQEPDRVKVHVAPTADVAWPVLVDPPFTYSAFGYTNRQFSTSDWPQAVNGPFYFHSDTLGQAYEQGSPAGAGAYYNGQYGFIYRGGPNDNAYVYRVDEFNVSQQDYPYPVQGTQTEWIGGIFNWTTWGFLPGQVWQGAAPGPPATELRGDYAAWSGTNFPTNNNYSGQAVFCVNQCQISQPGLPGGIHTLGLFELAVNGPNGYESQAPVAAMGNSALYESQTLNPTLSISHSAPPGYWVPSYTEDVTVTGSDAGLGMGSVALAGAGVSPGSVSQSCDGSYYSCTGANATLSNRWTFNVPEGAQGYTASATDIVQNSASPPQSWAVYVDHTAPTGALAPLPGSVRGTASITGTASDALSGVRDWQLQVKSPGGTWQNVCSPQPGNPSGNYACSWDTTTGPDGIYHLRAMMRDNTNPPNVGYTLTDVTVNVANRLGAGAPSSLDFSGSTAIPVEVNVVNGNGIVATHEFPIANTAGAHWFSRYVNTISAEQRDLWPGATQGGGYDVRLETAGDGSVSFFDETAYRERFVPDGNGGYRPTDSGWGTLSVQGDGSYQVTVNADGNTYTLDATGALQSRTANGNETATYDYASVNGQARLNSIHDPGGTATGLKYNADGTISEVDDPQSSGYVYNYDHPGRRWTVTNPSGQLTTYIYDTGGRLSEADMPDGNSTRLGYDGYNRVSWVEAVVPGSSGSDKTTHYYYGAPDGSCNPGSDAGRTTATYDDGSTQDYCYDGSGNITSTSPALDGIDPGHSYDSSVPCSSPSTPSESYDGSVTCGTADSSNQASFRAAGTGADPTTLQGLINTVPDPASPPMDGSRSGFQRVAQWPAVGAPTNDSFYCHDSNQNGAPPNPCPMDGMDVIDGSNSGVWRYLAVYHHEHTPQDPRTDRVSLAGSNDLLSWTWISDLDVGAGLPTIRDLGLGQYLVADEKFSKYYYRPNASTPYKYNSSVRLLYYRTPASLVGSGGIGAPDNQVALPRRLSPGDGRRGLPGNEGTPTIIDAHSTVTGGGFTDPSNSSVTIGYHYHWVLPNHGIQDPQWDQPAFGTVRNLSGWFESPLCPTYRDSANVVHHRSVCADQTAYQAFRRAGQRDVGDFRQFGFQGHSWRVYEARPNEASASSYRMFLYDAASLTLDGMLQPRTPQRSQAFGNPRVWEVPTPPASLAQSGSATSLVVSTYLHSPGAGQNEGGPLVYFHPVASP